MDKNVVILFYPFVESVPSQNLPYSLLYLERALRNLPIKLLLIDERCHPEYEKIIIEHKDNLLIAGVSCMLGYQVMGALKFSDLIKKYSNASIIWGGWFPTVFCEMVLKEKTVDFICVGQGEMALQSLIINLLDNKEVGHIDGIFSKGQQFIFPEKLSLKSFNTLPPINYELIDINKIIDFNKLISFPYRGTDYIATTGCPYDCTFCNLAVVFKKNWFSKPVDQIISDIKYLVQKANLSYITFSDDNFFVKKSFVIEFCEKLMASEMAITWEANAHIKLFMNNFNDEDIQKIKKSGCVRIRFGAESGDQQILDLLNKRITVDDNFKFVRLLKKHNISARMYTMVLFPGKPVKDFNKTLSMIAKARLIYSQIEANIDIFKPLPKTKLFALAQSSGFEYPDNISDLLKFFNKDTLYPWHQNVNYLNKILIFSKVYFSSLRFNIHKPYKGWKRILIYGINAYFFLNTLLRILFNYWSGNFLASLYLSKAISSEFEKIEKVASTRLR